VLGGPDYEVNYSNGDRTGHVMSVIRFQFSLPPSYND
jgi:hypothetical protein